MIDERSGFLSRLPATAVALIGVLGILAVGVIDYVTGVEYRVVPLYYVPLSLVAWELGRRPVVAENTEMLLAGDDTPLGSSTAEKEPATKPRSPMGRIE